MDSQVISLIIVVGLAVIELVFRIAFLIYIPRGRKPTAAMAWLLAIFLMPSILVLLLFFLIGGTKVSRRRRVRQKHIDRLTATTIQKTEQRKKPPRRYRSFIELGTGLGKFPAINGNALTPISSYDQTITQIVEDVSHAKRYIYLESYILALDSVTEPLFVALEEAVLRGVSVYVLFDAVGSRKYKRKREMKRRLTRAGIAWKRMLPISFLPRSYNRPDLRNHRKIIAIDGRVGYIGSLNLIDKHYQRKDDIYYEELVARVEGPVVNHFAAIVAGDWYSETAQIIREHSDDDVSPIRGGAPMQVVPSGPSYETDNNLKLFVQLLYEAKKKIVITNPYLVPPEPLLVALTTAAQRGVEVKIINSQAKDQLFVAHAQRSYYRQLINSGVQIYLHNAPVLLHAKHMTIDSDIAVIGSSNMDIRSFELDLEASLIVYDKKTVQKLQAIQRRNLANSRRYTRAMLDSRGLWKSFLDSVARLTSALQ